MTHQSVDAAFTRPLRDFLEAQGFSHIFSIGIYPNEMKEEDEAERGKENYWLEPVKPDDPRLTYIEAGHILNKINDAEILDMISGNDGVDVMIQVPEEVYHDYVNKREAHHNKILTPQSSYQLS